MRLLRFIMGISAAAAMICEILHMYYDDPTWGMRFAVFGIFILCILILIEVKHD